MQKLTPRLLSTCALLLVGSGILLAGPYEVNRQIGHSPLSRIHVSDSMQASEADSAIHMNEPYAVNRQIGYSPRLRSSGFDSRTATVRKTDDVIHTASPRNNSYNINRYSRVSSDR
jgi:hypothetical protein